MLYCRKPLVVFVCALITASCFDFNAVEDNAECHKNKSCAAGKVCNKHFECVDICDTSAQCEAGYICDNKTCLQDPRFCLISDDCEETEFCKNKTCVQKSTLGSSCMQSQECASDSCVDGFCCNSACDELCFSCSAENTGADNGVCSPLSDGKDDADDCVGGLACNGQGACHSSEEGSSCNEDYECTTNNCKGNFCRSSLCGNGDTDPGEECDDSNDTSSDSCTNLCKNATCGDGYVHATEEQCDLGTQNSNELANTCREDCRNHRCGDGVVDSGEVCDDGQENADTYQLAPFCNTQCNAYSPFCGDDTVNGSEECDTGHRNSDTEPNSCRTTCKRASCGDGVIDAGETCDDGVLNSNEGGACNESCEFPMCGNGIKDGNDECDNGAFNTNAPLSSFPTTPPPCRENCALAGCGDTIVDTPEDCDDGDTIDSQNGCSEGCKNNSVCGNNTVEPLFETCDDGNIISETECSYGTPTCSLCNDDCSQELSLVGPYCGDGQKAVQEDCDDGNTTDDSNGCSETCEKNNNCGDGRREDLFEVCDDGNDTSALRFNGQGQGSCVDDCSGIQHCGDNITSGTEVCDDGEDNGKGDTFCLSDCSARQSCGDGVVQGSEECDKDEETGSFFPYCTGDCVSLIHVGDVIIDSQSDLNAIAGQRKIDGNMTVTELWISQITIDEILEITGDLTIFNTNHLTRIEFPVLTRVHGDLLILPKYISSSLHVIPYKNDLLTHALFPSLNKIDGKLEINDNPALEQGDFNFSSASGIGGSVIVIDNPQYCPSLWFKTHFYDSSTENFKNNRSETDHEGCYPPIPMPIP